MIKLEWVPGTGDMEDILALREEVFCREQGFSLELERDEHDRLSWHVLLLDEGIPCGTARIYAEEYGVMRVGRICVLKEKRGRQLGDLIMRALIDRALQLGASEVRLGAQRTVQGFYERYGFRVSGDPYEEEGCPHVPMSAAATALSSILGCCACGGCAAGSCC